MDDDALAAVVRRGEEARDLDYKRPAAWDEGDKKACAELTKDILAMANTQGGYLVIGVAEGAGGQWERTGLSPDELKSWDTTRVNRFVQNYADPPINVGLRKVSVDDRWFVVLVVPQFTETPHICQKDYPQVLASATLYVRTANNESAPLKDAADLRFLIERAVRTRQAQMLEAMRAVLTGASIAAGPSDRERFEQQATETLAEAVAADPLADKDYDGYFVSVLYPGRFDPGRFSIAQLQQAAQTASINLRGWPWLYYRLEPDGTIIAQDGLRTEVTWRPWDSDSYDYWMLRRSGLLVHRLLFWEDAKGFRTPEGNTVLDPTNVVAYVTEAINTLVLLYEALGTLDEEITWRVSLLGVQNRTLQDRTGQRWVPRWWTSPISVIEHEQRHALEDWRAGLVDHALQACRDIFLRFQWHEPGEDVLRPWITGILTRSR